MLKATPSPPNYNLEGPLPRGSVSRAPLLGASCFTMGCFKPPQSPPNHDLGGHLARARRFFAAAPGGPCLAMVPVRARHFWPLPRNSPQVIDNVLFALLNDGAVHPPKSQKLLPCMRFTSNFGFSQASPKHKRPNWGQEPHTGGSFWGILGYR